MNRISWGEALRVVIGPALLVGPLAGAIGAFLIFGSTLVLSVADGPGSTEGFGGVTFFAMIFGGIVGIFVASPFCFTLGAFAFKRAVENEDWKQYPYWVGLGCLPGGAIVALLAMTGEAEADFLFWSLILLSLTGMVSAAICRRMLEKRFDEFALRDIQDVF